MLLSFSNWYFLITQKLKIFVIWIEIIAKSGPSRGAVLLMCNTAPHSPVFSLWTTVFILERTLELVFPCQISVYLDSVLYKPQSEETHLCLFGCYQCCSDCSRYHSSYWWADAPHVQTPLSKPLLYLSVFTVAALTSPPRHPSETTSTSTGVLITHYPILDAVEYLMYILKMC